MNIYRMLSALCTMNFDMLFWHVYVRIGIALNGIAQSLTSLKQSRFFHFHIFAFFCFISCFTDNVDFSVTKILARCVVTLQ